MRIRMTAGMSGTRDGAPWPALGEELEVPDTEGAELCAAGVATPVAAVAEKENATAEPAEKRATRARRS